MQTPADWQGRRLHFLGIGGAGMSGLAAIALTRGATVTGSDRSASAIVDGLREAGATITIGHDASALPDGPLEIVRSTAITEENPELAAARARGDVVLHRSELLAELVADRRTIAVAGAHGKTTTSSMVAHALHTLGLDPSWVIGGTVRTLGRAAHWGGEDGWLVVEADESDRSFLRLHPTISIVTNIELDHDARDLTALEADFTTFLSGSGEAVVPTEIARVAAPGTKVTAIDLPAGDPQTGVAFGDVTITLGVPGSHNAGNAALAIEALAQAGVDRAASAGALADFVGAGRRFEPLGLSASGARVVDDYAHHPTEVAATVEAARAWVGEGRVVAVFQPHLFSRTRDFAKEFAEALAAADEAILVPIYPARETQEAFPDITSASIEAQWPWHAVAEARGAADFAAAAELASGLAGEGDVIVVMGAGDIRSVGEQIVAAATAQPADASSASASAAASTSSRPAELVADQPMDRMTTVRAGGHAQWFARVDDPERLVALLAWARDEGLAVHAVGSGSNLLVSDDGVAGLVVRLDGDLGDTRFDGHDLIAGGGARFPKAAAAAARLGLAGIEFGVSIPGTVGGSVRMNANAYGGALANTLQWVEIATADGVERREPGALGFAYRHSALTDGEVVVRAAFKLTASEPATVKAALAELRDKRKATQPSGIKTFGSTFKNPPPWPDGPSAGQLLDTAGLRGLQHGAARLSPIHANFVENTGEATTAEIVALMQLARERVHAEHGVWLEPEVRTLGAVELPWA
ncbi:MAG: UDP-N-acetylmuramate--L-alanine ligase [Solirubrobacteraceae bacterium]|nr:UDP-N-acetylmuramate--L-alanine ligase [Solirubrobacteraceae bacterium]